MIPERIQGDGFKLEVELHGDYLRAYVFDGLDSMQVSIRLWALLAEQCRQHGVRQLLVVESLAYSVDRAEVGAIVGVMADCGFADMRTAFVELQDDISINEYGEILALEHGITVRVFGNETEARRWLVYGAPGPG